MHFHNYFIHCFFLNNFFIDLYVTRYKRVNKIIRYFNFINKTDITDHFIIITTLFSLHNVVSCL